MNNQVRYIVIYKDSPNAANRYYGPFATETFASFYMDNLPEPLQGGLKTTKPIYHQDSVQASNIIKNVRYATRPSYIIRELINAQN